MSSYLWPEHENPLIFDTVRLCTMVNLSVDNIFCVSPKFIMRDKVGNHCWVHQQRRVQYCRGVYWQEMECGWYCHRWGSERQKRSKSQCHWVSACGEAFQLSLVLQSRVAVAHAQKRWSYAQITEQSKKQFTNLKELLEKHMEGKETKLFPASTTNTHAASSTNTNITAMIDYVQACY